MKDMKAIGKTLVAAMGLFCVLTSVADGRAVTSIISNAAATISIANWESALDRKALNAELRGAPREEAELTLSA